MWIVIMALILLPAVIKCFIEENDPRVKEEQNANARYYAETGKWSQKQRKPIPSGNARK